MANYNALFVAFWTGAEEYNRYDAKFRGVQMHAGLPAGSSRVMWSIGVQTGETPLEFSEPADVRNPVLTCANVTDAPASFVADPFMIRAGRRWYMFFEVMNSARRMGEIGMAVSENGLEWTYQRIVLREPFHLSYPCVFRKNGRIFMIPETLALGCIQIYSARNFPYSWTPHALIPVYGADPSVFEYGGVWWMFVGSNPYENDTLRLYSANLLRGPWREHPESPIVRNDKRSARPGGRVTVTGSRIIRYAQDCERDYGTMVRAFEITELTPHTYRERELTCSPVLTATDNQGWRSRRAHHVDPHETDEGRWIVCVDGDTLD